MSILESLRLAGTSMAAASTAFEDLQAVLEKREWQKVEDVRARLLAGVDGWVDNLVSAAMFADANRRKAR